MTAAGLSRPKQKAPRSWTYSEMVAELPETHQPLELWNGEIVMSPAPHPSHQEIVLNYAQTLKAFASRHRLGKVYVSPVDVVLTQRRVVQPDVIFIGQARLGIVKTFIDGVPDLAMEVISETSWQRDRIQKKALYEQVGLPEYWIIDPDTQTIEVFALVRGVYQLHSRAQGSETARSGLLRGFKVSFTRLVG
jgi:Uma2 family endonuclease